MPAIHIEHLSHTYRPHFWSKPKPALKDLCLDIEEGEIFGYLGANGAGKTTTIKILVGLQVQSHGIASVFGKDTRQVDSRLQVGFQPENPYFYEYLTAEEALRFYAALCKTPRRERGVRCGELLEFVGLQEAQRVRVGAFSKGMRQRLGIAQALIHRPRLVILDEPQSGLDPVGRHQVRSIIEGLRDQGLTVFFSSHILSDVEQVADRVGLLVQGELKAVGRIDELVTKEVRSVEAEVEGVTPEAIAALKKEGLTGQERGGRMLYTFPDWQASDEGLAAIAKAGGRLRGLEESCESLEEYFMRCNHCARAAVGDWSGGGDQ
ncbi:MAG: ABC transporter ATP-binding protein [Planctomycetota bacterium]|jgi:ABC-2 type transport system ATP-binding protein